MAELEYIGSTGWRVWCEKEEGRTRDDNELGSGAWELIGISLVLSSLVKADVKSSEYGIGSTGTAMVAQLLKRVRKRVPTSRPGNQPGVTNPAKEFPVLAHFFASTHADISLPLRF